MGKSTTIAIIVLAVLLVLAVGYIGFVYYNSAKINEQNTIYGLGYQQAVVDLVNAAVKCEPVPVRVNENITINMIAVDCLQQAPAAQ